MPRVEGKCATDTSIWNVKSVTSPAFKTVEYTKQEYERLFATNTNFHLMFGEKLKQLLRTFDKSRGALAEETYVLERVIYKNWNALRKERSMQSMRKLRGSLAKWTSCVCVDKLSEVIDRLIVDNPRRSSSSTSRYLLPSRQVLAFYAMRLYAAYRLADYTLRLIRNKLEPDLSRQMRHNVFMANNLLYMSAASRLYCLFRRYQRVIAHVYNCLREYVTLFKPSDDDDTDTNNIDQLPKFLMLTNKWKSEAGLIEKLNISDRMTIEDDDQDDDIGTPVDRSAHI